MTNIKDVTCFPTIKLFFSDDKFLILKCYSTVHELSTGGDYDPRRTVTYRTRDFYATHVVYPKRLYGVRLSVIHKYLDVEANSLKHLCIGFWKKLGK